MVQEAEQYKAEDEVQREKIAAKNSLESLAFNMKSTAEDEKLKDKLSPEDKQKILDKCNEVISWLDRNQVSWNRGSPKGSSCWERDWQMLGELCVAAEAAVAAWLDFLKISWGWLRLLFVAHQSISSHTEALVTLLCVDAKPF